MQWLGTHISKVTKQHTKIEELMYMVSSVLSTPRLYNKDHLKSCMAQLGIDS